MPLLLRSQCAAAVTQSPPLQLSCRRHRCAVAAVVLLMLSCSRLRCRHCSAAADAHMQSPLALAPRVGAGVGADAGAGAGTQIIQKVNNLLTFPNIVDCSIVLQQIGPMPPLSQSPCCCRLAVATAAAGASPSPSPSCYHCAAAALAQ